MHQTSGNTIKHTPTNRNAVGLAEHRKKQNSLRWENKKACRCYVLETE